MSRLAPLGLICLAALVVPGPLAAQDGFLFEQPRVTLSVTAGQSAPGGGGDVFDLFTRELTLERGDFAASSIGGEIGVRIAPRFDLVFGVSRAKSSKPSEFRDWVDNDDLPIEQVTSFTRVPLTLSVRYYPLDRGRAIGRYAWVPAAFLPYLGGGAGVVWYELSQQGDFVDFETLEIFRDHLKSTGAGLTGHVFGGAQYWLFERIGVTGEARYSWGSASLENGFSDFGTIDLDGFQWAVGIAARF